MSASPSDFPHPPHVLIVEDEAKTRESLAEGLRMESWIVAAVATGREAISHVDAEPLDLVVLDRMLPDGDGLAVLRHLRQCGVQTPVLMLTACGAPADRVAGLEAGANDYMTKPFAFADLVGRCRALLRWPVMSTGEILRCGDLRLDTCARVAERAGGRIPLTPTEVDLLEYLLRNQGQVVTREMLEREVWKQTHWMRSFDHVVDDEVMRLCRKINGNSREPLICTVRGVGYRMGAESA